MVAQADDIVDGLLADVVQIMPGRGVHPAGEHEVLPDQDAFLVAEVVEPVILVDTAAPHAQHVHVDRHRVVDGLAVDGVVDPREEIVAGDVVRAFHEYPLTVQHETEALAGLVIVGDKAEGAQSDFVRPFIPVLFRGDRCLETVAVRVTIAVAPPQPRVPDLEVHDHLVAAFPQRHLSFGVRVSRGLVGDTDNGGRAAGRVDGDLLTHVGHLPAHLRLHEIGVVYPYAAPRGDGDGAPYARCQQAWSPVPSVMVPGLAGERRYFLVQQAAVLALVVGGRVVIGQGIVFGQVGLDRGVEKDAQGVARGLDETFDIGPPCAEHVVGPDDERVVEIDIRIGVEPMAGQHDVLPPHGVVRHVESGLIDPVLLVNPLHAPFVELQERVIDDVVRHQVGVHHSRHRGRIPVVEPRLMEPPSLAELPGKRLRAGGMALCHGHCPHDKGCDKMSLHVCQMLSV